VTLQSYPEGTHGGLEGESPGEQPELRNDADPECAPPFLRVRGASNSSRAVQGPGVSFNVWVGIVRRRVCER